MIKMRTTGSTTITSGNIPLSQSYTSEAYDVTQLQGFFSLQWTVTGTGTMKAEVLTSNDGVTFNDVDPDITTAQTASTGISGVNMTDFEVTTCNQIKIRFSETGGLAAIAVVARLQAR